MLAVAVAMEVAAAVAVVAVFTGHEGDEPS